MSKKELIKAHLLELLKLSGVSGREAQVIRYMVKELTPLVDKLEVDPMGNVYTVLNGKRSGPKVLITAHSDEIGLIVSNIEKNGFIRFNKAGGVQDNLLPGRIVELNGHIGIVGVKAGHLASESERAQVKKANDLYIDVGAKSKDEVESMGIKIGTPAIFVSEARFLANPDLIVSRALDDRTGCAVMLALAESLKDRDFNGELHLVVTVQEEVGLRGATVASFKVDPDIAIALDTIPSGDTPDVNFSKELPVGIGLGPVFQVTSGSAKGMFADSTVLSMLIEAANKTNTPYQTVTFTGGNTDATAMHLTRAGIPSGAVTIARRYSHSPVELLDLNDAAGAFTVLQSLIREMPESIEWRLPGEF